MRHPRLLEFRRAAASLTMTARQRKSVATVIQITYRLHWMMQPLPHVDPHAPRGESAYKQ
jgi:hypothetical protein